MTGDTETRLSRDAVVSSAVVPQQLAALGNTPLHNLEPGRLAKSADLDGRSFDDGQGVILAIRGYLKQRLLELFPRFGRIITLKVLPGSSFQIVDLGQLFGGSSIYSLRPQRLVGSGTTLTRIKSCER